MAGGTRMVVALLAGIVLFSSIPYSQAEDSSEQNLKLTIVDDNINDYYLQGESLELEVAIHNPYERQVIQNNPSCDYVIEVFDSSDYEVYNSHHRCRQQSQSLELNSLETVLFDKQTWDFTNQNGEYIKTGIYRLKVSHSMELISHSLTLKYYANSTIINNLQLNTNFIQINDDYGLAQFFIFNPTEEKIITENEECVIILENEYHMELFDDCFQGTTVLHPYENIYAANLLISTDWKQYGDSIHYYFLGNSEISSFSINGLSSFNTTNQNLIDENLLHISPLKNEQHDVISVQLHLEDGLHFDQVGCEGEIYIVNDLGNLIKNDPLNVCDETSSTTHSGYAGQSLEVYSWELSNEYGCLEGFGKYTIIVNIGENYRISDFSNFNKNKYISCSDTNINVEYENYLLESSVYSKITISSIETDIRLYDDCIVMITFEIMEKAATTPTWDLCDYTIGNFLTPPNSISEITQITEIEQLSDYKEITLALATSTEFNHRYKETLYTSNADFAHNPSDMFTVNGEWSLVQYNDVNCWMISQPNSAYILNQNQEINAWTPQIGWEGRYSAQDSNVQNNDCEVFGLPIISVNEIFSENKIVETVTNLPNELVEEKTISIQEITLVTVTSTSLILGLLVFVSNTESLRIPTTTAGLWLLGLVGKTHETSDGRFQRGRLIGYLTANPGCHFRALMAALSMSNGQITHHLRLLENQELIWRVNDGRFVRYYPLNNSLYPGMNPENLPVPLLSPDPKSLQGKILTLLDDEHQYGEFPTQSELAKKLEKSQQLISHHLRTLQKYGLVEKRKMGIKNRYKLTKEAIFLLETDLEFVKLKQ